MSPFLAVLKKVCKMSDEDRYAAFGESNFDKIIEKIDFGTELIDKYYEWEENNVITVGDEVVEVIETVNKSYLLKPVKFWVTNIDQKKVISGINNEGLVYCCAEKYIRKTGRHNDNIIELLKDLQGLEE